MICYPIHGSIGNRGMNWLKLHHDVRTDRKLSTLDAEEFRTWLHLLVFASEQEEHRGVIYGIEEQLLALEVSGGNVNLLRRTLDRLQGLRIVSLSSINNAPHQERNAPVTPHIAFLQFDKRQHLKPSDRPERVRDRVQRYRAAHGNAPDQIGNAPVTPVTPDVTPRNAHRADTERDTESLPPLNPPPPAAPLAPVADAPGVSGVAKPNKSGELIDLVGVLGVPIEMQAQDHSALKKSQLSAAQVAEAYCAAYRGEWGGDWLQDNLSVQRVIGRWAGYQASKQPRTAPPGRRNGRHDANDLIASRLRAIRAAGGSDDDHDPTIPGRVAPDLRALSAGHGQAVARLPPPQRE
jgi:hypothetical protein